MEMKNIVFIFFLLASFAFAQSQAAKELADTERAFSKASEDHGMFKAFYDYFTDDGIRFSPTPTYARFELASAAKGEKPDFKLAWYPTWTRVSSSGDMGFDLGPWAISALSDKKRPPRYGYFFSIWRKTQQGWRVVLDSGIRTPQPVPEQESAWQGKQKQVAARKETKPGLSLLEAEQAFRDSVESTGAASAYRKSLAPEFTFLRNQSLPIRSLSEVENSHPLPERSGEVTLEYRDRVYQHGSLEMRAGIQRRRRILHWQLSRIAKDGKRKRRSGILRALLGKGGRRVEDLH
jgi:hypothetical protein